MKPRLDYFLIRGGDTAIGDTMDHKSNCAFSIHNGNKNCFKKLNRLSEEYFMASFASRENKGVQPVPDDFPVNAILRGGAEYKDLAGCFEWWGNGSHIVKSWKPDIDKLIEQQAEYDAKQEKPIEELMIDAKEKKVEFKEGQDVYSEIDGEMMELTFGCYTPCKKFCVVFAKDGGFASKSINRVLAKKPKSKEEIELEEAKEKRHVNLINKYESDKIDINELSILLWKMEENGDLAEIILPLEK